MTMTLAEVTALLNKKAERSRTLDLLHGEGATDYDVRLYGNFATAMVKFGNITGLGSAKRNPEDTSNDDIGEMIACSRAIDDVLGQLCLLFDEEIDEMDRRGAFLLDFDDEPCYGAKGVDDDVPF